MRFSLSLSELAVEVSGVTKEKLKVESKQDPLESRRKEQPSLESHTIECGCCYNEVIFEEMVQCSEGHLFCVNCLQVSSDKTSKIQY